MNLFDQAALAHQRELDQAFAAGEQHAQRALADVVDTTAKIRHAAELDAAYRDGFEACAIYATIAIAIALTWLFVFTTVGVHLYRLATS